MFNRECIDLNGLLVKRPYEALWTGQHRRPNLIIRMFRAYDNIRLPLKKFGRHLGQVIPNASSDLLSRCVNACLALDGSFTGMIDTVHSEAPPSGLEKSAGRPAIRCG